MLAVMFEMIQQNTTNTTIDWGMIATATAPVVTIIVTWYLQRKTTKETAAELAQAHEVDKQEAVKKRSEDTEAILSGQHELADAINTQLIILANARIKTLKERIKAAGGVTNGDPATTIENASDQIDKYENQLDALLDAKDKQ